MKTLSPAGGLVSRFPGTALCIGIALAAFGLEHVERILAGKAFLETLNIALILGVILRSVRKPADTFNCGIRFCSKTLLNIAIVLLGTTFSLQAVWSAGPEILFAVLGMVIFSMIFTCWAGRMNGLSRNQTLLVACGDSICGNSAIMAAAPAIQASDEDVGATIAFTAAGGLAVVLGLPVLLPFLNMSGIANGAVAGLTVYAVPQVMAAAAPFGPAALHVGTLVKLMRVLMLGPVCAVLSLTVHHKNARTQPLKPSEMGKAQRLFSLVPWYIAGFMAMIIVRSLGVIPEACIPLLSQTATFLTILAMAALGLGIDIRSVFRAGRPLVLTVAMSLAGLLGASILLVRILNCA
ncbi:YeiH family protein [Gluconobacter oxydans]|uniref:YeiH family protein n=1 Tax=Gluconobacter oxydans TaxID=442 RepID=UPI0039E9276E